MATTLVEGHAHRHYLTRFSPSRISPEMFHSILPKYRQDIIYQIHSGKIGVPEFVDFINRSPEGISVGLDLSQKRRLVLEADLSKSETKIRYKYGSDTERDYGQSQLVYLDDTVFIRVDSSVRIDPNYYDHVISPATSINTDTLVAGCTIGLGARAKMIVDAITPQGVKGRISSFDPAKNKLYDRDGFVSPSSLQLRVKGEDQLSEVDLEYLRSVPLENRHKLKSIAISFAHDPDKVKKAISQINELGYIHARFDLKIETLEALRNLESLASIDGVGIVFACGDLGEATAEAGVNLEDVVESGVVRLKRLRDQGYFKGLVSLAYGFGEERTSEAAEPEMESEIVLADNRHEFHANMERIFGENIGLWHTGIGLKQSNPAMINKIVEGSIYGCAVSKAHLEELYQGVQSGYREGISEFRLHPKSVDELRRILFANGYGYSEGEEQEWLHRTNIMFGELYGRNGEGCQTILKIDREGNLCKENSSVFLRIFHRNDSGLLLELFEEQYIYDDDGKPVTVMNHEGIPGEKKSTSESRKDSCMRLLAEELGISYEYGSRGYTDFSQKIVPSDINPQFETAKKSQKYFGLPSRYKGYCFEMEMDSKNYKEEYVEYDEQRRIKSRFKWVKYRGDDLFDQLQYPRVM